MSLLSQILCRGGGVGHKGVAVSKDKLEKVGRIKEEGLENSGD